MPSWICPPPRVPAFSFDWCRQRKGMFDDAPPFSIASCSTPTSFRRHRLHCLPTGPPLHLHDAQPDVRCGGRRSGIACLLVASPRPTSPPLAPMARGGRHPVFSSPGLPTDTLPRLLQVLRPPALRRLRGGGHGRPHRLAGAACRARALQGQGTRQDPVRSVPTPHEG